MNCNFEIFSYVILPEHKSEFWKFMHVTEKLSLPVWRTSVLSRR